eukprot:3026076-Amphidinium_carterae.1
MKKVGDPPGTFRNHQGRLVDEKTKRFVADPNKALKTSTRRVGGRRSTSASTPRDERSRSPKEVEIQENSSIPHSTLPDPAN